jgi:hypothetical protein
MVAHNGRIVASSYDRALTVMRLIEQSAVAYVLKIRGLRHTLPIFIM